MVLVGVREARVNMDVRNMYQESKSFLSKEQLEYIDSWETVSTSSQNSDAKSEPKHSPREGSISNGTFEFSTLILKAKQEFHSRRVLRLKHLPSDATDEDIRRLVHPLEVKDVQLNRLTQTAKVFPMLPESLEVWPTEKEYSLRDHKVLVASSSTDGMLCVAHLPLVYTEQEFSNLVQMYGPVARCFLLRSEKTGEYKGYGFVEYSSKEVAFKAKSLLDKKCIGDCTLHCNWLDSSLVTYSSLHSKCLFVDHLPPNYRDLVEFRKIFSVHVSPSYCQIALKNGQPLGFGLVEFENSSDAESAQIKLNHYQIEEYKIRVTFCIPGYRAMVIYNKLTSELASNGKRPLLPDPPMNSVAFGQLQMLALQNPQLFQNLQNIVSSQLSNGSGRNSFDEKCNGGCKSPQSHGLLGSVPSPDTSPSSTASASSLSSTTTSTFEQMNPNVHAALVLLLATQMQFQMGVQQPSLLGNPQLLSLVQTFLKQHTGFKDATNGLQNVMSLLQNNGQKQASTSGNNLHQFGRDSKDASPSSNGLLTSNRTPWTNPAINGNCNWQQQTFSRKLDGNNGPAQYKTRKVPLLPDPPLSTKCTPGLLPTPDSGKSNHLLVNTHGGAKSVSALHNGHSKYHMTGGLLETPDGCNNQTISKSPLLGHKPAPMLNGPGQKIPLLGDKPGAVPIHNSATNGCHRSKQNAPNHDHTKDGTSSSSFAPTSPLHPSPVSPLLADSATTLQQILPLILSQPQLLFSELSKSQAQQQVTPQLSPMTSIPQQQQLRNLSPPIPQTVSQNQVMPLAVNASNQNGNGMSFGVVSAGALSVQCQPNPQLAALAQLHQQMQVQGMTPALMGLLLQMSQGLGATKGCNDANRQVSQSMVVPPPNHQPHKNGFQNHNGFSPTNGHLGTIAPQVPGKLLFPNPISAISPVATLMALNNSKSSPLVGFPSSSFMMPTSQPNPPNITQLMAEIQQRGSLLGDFWQAAQGDMSSLYSPQCNGKLPIGRPTVANLGNPINGKRKLHVLLPTPETSPEGCYVGQHSQGIGGHYAESYRKKRHI